jgi:hypothetical protein
MKYFSVIFLSIVVQLISSSAFAGSLFCDSQLVTVSLEQTDASTPYSNYVIGNEIQKIDQFYMTQNALAFRIRLDAENPRAVEVSAMKTVDDTYVGKIFLGTSVYDVTCAMKR